MADNHHADPQPTVTGLVGGILEDAQKLVRQEVALARCEVAEACAKAKTGVELLSGALLLCSVGGVLLGFMAVKLLHQFLLPNHEWACFGIVGGVCASSAVRRFTAAARRSKRSTCHSRRRLKRCAMMAGGRHCGVRRSIRRGNTLEAIRRTSMDAVTDLPEQDSADMRQEIDNTRSAMANKLEALENKMIDTVQSANHAVQESIQSAKETVASVKETFDIEHQVQQRPWTMVGGCFLAGLALTCLIPRGRPQSSKAPGGPAEKTNGAAATPPSPAQPEPARRPGVLEPFQEEIDKVKGIAIGYVMGLVRDSIKESVPQLAPKIDDLMNGLTTKLGGEPIERGSA